MQISLIQTIKMTFRLGPFAWRTLIPELWTKTTTNCLLRVLVINVLTPPSPLPKESHSKWTLSSSLQCNFLNTDSTNKNTTPPHPPTKRVFLVSWSWESWYGKWNLELSFPDHRTADKESETYQESESETYQPQKATGEMKPKLSLTKSPTKEHWGWFMG